MGLHPHCKSFGTTLGEPTVECARHRTMGILEETELLDEAIVVSVWCGRGKDGSAHHDIGMAVNIFREGMDDDVRAL
jgi:hypothetical protein